MSNFDTNGFLDRLAGGGSSADRTVSTFREIDSTSDELIRRIDAGAVGGTVIVADTQTGGRGRRGRSWHSPDAGNLYVSLAVELSGVAPSSIPMVPLAAGIAAAEAIGDTSPVLLKWPNDVLNARGRKLGGILCELPFPTRRPLMMAVGLGLNLGSFDLPDDLVATAASLGDSPREPLPPEQLAAGWVAELEDRVEQLAQNGPKRLISDWKRRAEPFGRRVRIDGIEGRTVDLDDRGLLVVQQSNGVVRRVPGGIVETM